MVSYFKLLAVIEWLISLLEHFNYYPVSFNKHFSYVKPVQPGCSYGYEFVLTYFRYILYGQGSVYQSTK